MNFVFLSPHFPPNYRHFVVGLRRAGATVLGIGEELYESLGSELQSALHQYYQVDNMEDYDQVLRAVGHFTHRWGKIDRIESLNEHWLEMEARLRTDFNVFGLQCDEIERIRRKSMMKEVFCKAEVDVPRGGLIKDIEGAGKWIDEVGYPVVVKPDRGVGAAHTHKLESADDLERFFHEKPDQTFILEEFIPGEIYSYDGLVNRDGEVVFAVSTRYTHGVLEFITLHLDVAYYTLREIPPALEEAGKKILETYQIRERFFHFEFFHLSEEDRWVGLEVNMRPPGGMTTDMFNFTCDFNIYSRWANMVVHNTWDDDWERKYFCMYIGRRAGRDYDHSHREISEKYGDHIVFSGQMAPLFRPVMGDYTYLVRGETEEKVLEMMNYIGEATVLT